MSEFYVYGDERDTVRSPAFLPLAEGHEWHRFADGMRSNRWVEYPVEHESYPAAGNTTEVLCTDCGFRCPPSGIAGHNSGHTRKEMSA